MLPCETLILLEETHILSYNIKSLSSKELHIVILNLAIFCFSFRFIDFKNI